MKIEARRAEGSTVTVWIFLSHGMDVDEVVLGLALQSALCAKTKDKKNGIMDRGKMKSWFLWSWFDKNIRLGCFPSGLPTPLPPLARTSPCVGQ